MASRVVMARTRRRIPVITDSSFQRELDGMISALVGIRTQDPSIKSAVLYQLSYERNTSKLPRQVDFSDCRRDSSHTDVTTVQSCDEATGKNSCLFAQAAGRHRDHTFHEQSPWRRS